jgi:hypothetical protein
MFSDEYGVIVETDGQILTFFVPNDFIQTFRRPVGSEQVDGKVRVHVLDEEGGVIYLPREPFEGSPFICVSPDLLEAA